MYASSTGTSDLTDSTKFHHSYVDVEKLVRNLQDKVLSQHLILNASNIYLMIVNVLYSGRIIK